MNDNWTDDLRAETIDVEPRQGFQDELRATLRTEWHTQSPAPVRGPRKWRPWTLGAVAACLVLLVASLVLFGRTDSNTTPATVPDTDVTTGQDTLPTTSTTGTVVAAPTVADVDITDPLAITLDAWIDPSSDTQLPATFTAIDKNALPAGWSLFDETAAVYQFPSSGTELWYSYQAVVTTDDGTEFELYLDRGDHVDRCSTLGVEEVDISKRPIDATTAEAVLCLRRDDGFTVAVVPVGTADETSQWSAFQVGQRVLTTEVDELPHPDLIASMGTDEPAAVTFGGTLSGARWAITVDPGDLRSMSTYVAGNRFSGFSNDDLSQPGTGAVDSVYSTRDGVPGYGVLVYGYAPPQVASVVVETSDGNTARLPVFPRDNETFYVVPVPDTVNVSRVTFLDDDDTIVAITDAPSFPRGLGGGIDFVLTPHP